jgi:hypothetical protein
MHFKQFLIALFLVTGLILPALATEIPVNIKADTLRYVEGTPIIEAQGSVEVRFENVTIYADLLKMDSETNIATAEGNVRIFTDDYSAVSDFIVYDASREVSDLSGFKTSISTSDLAGNLHLSAREISDHGDKMLGEWGALTTCDNEQRHFFLAAQRVEYYPRDKIIGYNAILFVGKAPVLWLPVVFYDLSRKQEQNFTIGHNDVEGDYIKSAWGYPYGVLYLDQMQKKGFGHGTWTPYALGALGAGSLYLYHLDEQDTKITDWITRIDHTKRLDPYTTLDIDHSLTATYLIPSGRRDQTSFGLNLAHKHEGRWGIKLKNFDNRIGMSQTNSFRFNQSQKKVSTDYSINYDLSKRDPQWIRSAQRFSHRRPLWWGKTMLSTRANYYNNVAEAGAPGDERLEPVIDITGSEPGYSWRYSQNWYIDLDQDTYTADSSYQYLEKQPEIEVKPNPVNMRFFTLRPKFGFGRYHEVRYVSALGGNRDYTAERYKATLDASRSIPLGLGTVMALGAGVDQYLYAPGDQMYAYRESGSLRTSLGGFFRNNINYRKGSTDGNSPFVFDKLGGHYHNAREQMTFYYQSKFRWTIDGGHNWQTHKWFDVNTNMLVKPDKRVYWNTRTGWSIENRRYKDLVNSLTLVPYSFYSTKFSTVSDMNAGRVKSGSIQHSLYLLHGQPNQWQIKVGQIYESASQQFKVRDIMVVKDLHCWVLKYTYSDYRKEFSMTFSLKAMPGEPLGMSSGRGFYFDTLEKELKELEPKDDIRRY